MAHRLRTAAAGLLIAAAFAAAGCRGAPVRLASHGAALAPVVLARDAIPPERHAAIELAHFLERVTRARFEVVTPESAPEPPRILVGPGAAAATGRPVRLEGLGEDGIVVRTAGGDLVLAGGRPRGTLNAVYTFLQETVGCRFWTKDVSTIPQRPELAVGPLDLRYVPPFSYRDDYWYGAFDPDWAARNRLFGTRVPGDEARGGRLVYAGFVHTFDRLIPPETYFPAHPEWFSEIDGVRTAKGAQLCLTNESLRHEVARRVIAEIRRQPGARIASVSQNDRDGRCTCARCRASDEREGSPAGTLIRFVNGVAAEVARVYPDVLIDTLAYQYTRRPPRRARPARNVVVRLCSIECSFGVPLNHRRNASFREDLVGWQRIAPRLFVWDYTTNFRHYLMPHPNLGVLAPNLRFLADHGVTGVFEEGNYQCPGTEMAPLRTWLLAQLLWNPWQDPERLIDEFLAGYYGAAAPHVRELVDRLHRAAREREAWLGFYDDAEKYDFLSLRVLTAALGDVDAARRAAGGDSALVRRVEALRLPLLYAFLLRWRELAAEHRPGEPWPVPRDPAVLLAEVRRRIAEAGVTVLGEGQPLERLEEYASGLQPIEDEGEPGAP